jgi:Secretion system C-terminal sorting domain
MHYFKNTILLIAFLGVNNLLMAQRLWTHKCINDCFGEPLSLIVDGLDNSYVLANHDYNGSRTTSDIIKISKNGLQQWQKQLSLNATNYLIKNAILDSTHLVVVGYILEDIPEKLFIAKVLLSTGSTVAFSTLPIKIDEPVGATFVLSKDQNNNYNFHYTIRDKIARSNYHLALSRYDRNLTLKKYIVNQDIEIVTAGEGSFTKDGSFIYHSEGSRLIKTTPDWTANSWSLPFVYPNDNGLSNVYSKKIIEADNGIFYYLANGAIGGGEAKSTIVKIIPYLDSVKIAWVNGTTKGGLLLYDKNSKRLYTTGSYENLGFARTLTTELNLETGNIIWSDLISQTDSAFVSVSSAALDKGGKLFIVGVVLQRSGGTDYSFGYYNNQRFVRLDTYAGNCGIGVGQNESASELNFLSNNTLIVSGSACESLRVNTPTTLAYASPYRVGIQAVGSVLDWKLYPNPTKESITINLSNSTGKTKVQIINVLGHAVVECFVENAKTTIPINHLPTGNYIVKITNYNQISAYKKLILL